MLVRFTKMHGLGNDFMLLDLISQDIQIQPEHIRAMADRRLGVGFDQLLTVEPPDDPAMDFKVRIFNADGSEAEQCGNGARCFMRFVRDRGLTIKHELKLQTKSGSIQCALASGGDVVVNMGPPQLAPEKVPFIADTAQITYRLELTRNQAQLCVGLSEIEASVLSMGNPHLVMLVDCVEAAKVQGLGPLLETHPRFPERVNVGFMEIVDSGYVRLRVYERGVGETRACGSGACAAVVAGRLQGLLEGQVKVELPGGSLTVEWEGDSSDVLLTGPACRVYEGRVQV